jgi:hypothetical protein
MLKIATPLAFDSKGNTLHKNDLCKMLVGDQSVTVLDVIPQNWCIVVMPNGETKSMAATELVRVDEANADVEKFESPSPDNGEGPGQERVKLLTPNDLIYEGTADSLLAVMKSVARAVRVIAFKVNRVERKKIAEDGVIMAGVVECQVAVQDNFGMRRGTASLRLAIEDEKVKIPTEFEGGGKEYPFTEAGFKKWLNIPATPYVSKKPISVIRSNRDSY